MPASVLTLLTMQCLFILFYATTWAPVVWTVNSEMMVSRVRARSVAIATSGNWSFNFLLSFFTPFITGDSKWYTRYDGLLPNESSRFQVWLRLRCFFFDRCCNCLVRKAHNKLVTDADST